MSLLNAIEFRAKLAQEIASFITREIIKLQNVPTFDPIEIEGMRRMETVINEFEIPQNTLDQISTIRSQYDYLEEKYFELIYDTIWTNAQLIHEGNVSYTISQVHSLIEGMRNLLECVRFFFHNESFRAVHETRE